MSRDMKAGEGAERGQQHDDTSLSLPPRPTKFEPSFREVRLPSAIHTLYPLNSSRVACGDNAGRIHIISHSSELVEQLALQQTDRHVVDIVSLNVDTIIAAYGKSPPAAWIRDSQRSWTCTPLPAWAEVRWGLCKATSNEILAPLRNGGVLSLKEEPQTGALTTKVLWESKNVLGIYAQRDGGLFVVEPQSRVSFFDSTSSKQAEKEWTSTDASMVMYGVALHDGRFVLSRASGAIEVYNAFSPSLGTSLNFPPSKTIDIIGITEAGHVIGNAERETVILYENVGDDYKVHQLASTNRPMCVHSLPNNGVFLGGFRGGCEIWRKAPQGSWLKSLLNPHSECITSCCFLPGTGLITGSYDSTVRVWSDLPLDCLED